MGLSTLTLVFFLIGAASCQILQDELEEDRNSLPRCNLAVLNPCMMAAVQSYIKNTKGEQAAELPLDRESSKAVGTALSADINSPTFNGTATCSIVTKIDMEAMSQCLRDVTRGCTIEVPESGAQLFASTIPSLRAATPATSGTEMIMLCNPACLDRINARMAALTACWRASETAVEDLLKGSQPDCKPIADYMKCQWNISIGCSYTEELTRNHLVSLNDTIIQCGIVLPTGALAKPSSLTTSGGTSTSLQFINACSTLMAGALVSWITNAVFGTWSG